PVGFRRVFGVTRAIPEPTGSELRRVARALGFDGDQVYLLPTGMSAVNAMMVGPLPWSRCLCVTDGLVHVLDAEALSGVVAHEVGHARMGHPALLVLLAVILPLMLLQPLGLLPVDDLDLAWQVLLGSFLVSVLWLIVRALAHRFELEADIASVRALGAAPCSRALSAVSNATIAVRRSLLGRLSTFHPEESTRLMTMLRYERDAGFRSRFDATGRRLRVVILAAVSVAAVLAGIAWSLDWTYQRAIWHFHAGDFVAARAARQAIGDEVPDRWRDSWERVGSELDAAVELAPDATDWATARTTLRQRAGTRAVAELLRQGPAAATPWFALTVDVSDPADADYLLMHQLYELCRAIRDADTPRADAIRAVIRQRPIPEALAPVLR
ncbi:MAG: M48 family metalloprotease, partial [Planctomycetes bacterium]|nr:M48 family metalloprotease [Planctomycetota bacterium]